VCASVFVKERQRWRDINIMKYEDNNREVDGEVATVTERERERERERQKRIDREGGRRKESET